MHEIIQNYPHNVHVCGLKRDINCDKISNMQTRKRFTISIAVIFFAAGFLLGAVFACPTVAHAAGITVESVTYLDENGETVSVSNGSWARNDCTVRVSTDAEKVRFSYCNVNGQQISEKTVACQDGYASATVETEGTTRLMVTPIAADGGEGVAVEQSVKLDKTAPRAPIWNDEEWETPAYGTYTISFQLSNDSVSGLDYRKSTYWFTEADGTEGAKTPISNDNPGQPRRIAGLCGNGTLHILLYDNAGNWQEFSRDFTQSRVPTVKPTVTFSVTEGYAKTVTATVDWAGYDVTDEKINCSYEIFYGDKSEGRKKYKSPLQIEREGSVTVRAYYSPNGEETYIEETTTKVDRTGPPDGVMRESFRLNIDLMSERALWISVRVYDVLSGVKSVKLHTGQVFELYDKDLYRLTVTDRNNFRIVAEDNVGNETTFQYSNPNFDYESVWKYAKLYQSLNASDYSAAGWAAVQSAFRSLGAYYNEINPQTSILSERKRAVERAIEGKLSVTVRLTEFLDGFGSFTFDIPAEVPNLLKGDSVNVRLSGGKGILAEVLQKCKKEAGVSGGVAHSVSILIANGEGERVALNGQYSFTFRMTEPVGKAVVYYYDGQNAIQVDSVTDGNGAVTVTANAEGNFIVVAAVGSQKEDLPAGFYVGKNYYQWKWVGGAIGVIVATCVIVFFGLYFILRRVRGGSVAVRKPKREKIIITKRKS